MKKITIIVLMLLVNGANAYPITCPQPDLVRAQQLVEALNNPYDTTQWNFRSQSFIVGNTLWYIEFGSFFPDHLSIQQALILGQNYYKNIQLNIPYPTPVRIPSGYLCNYMPEGHEYWVSAIGKAVDSPITKGYDDLTH